MLALLFGNALSIVVLSLLGLLCLLFALSTMILAAPLIGFLGLRTEFREFYLTGSCRLLNLKNLAVTEGFVC